MQAGDHLFSSDSLEEVGLQNRVDDGGWGEKSLASRIPPMSSGSEHPYSHFLLCFLHSGLSCRCRASERAGRKHQGDARPAGLLSALAVSSHPTPVLSPGTENYLCLQIAFDSHELFSCLPTGLGMGEFLNRRAEKSGRWQKEH